LGRLACEVRRGLAYGTRERERERERERIWTRQREIVQKVESALQNAPGFQLVSFLDGPVNVTHSTLFPSRTSRTFPAIRIAYRIAAAVYGLVGNVSLIGWRRGEGRGLDCHGLGGHGCGLCFARCK